MTQKYFVDTNILIDYLRGVDDSVHFLENAAYPIYISSLTVAELFAGVREGQERKILQSFVTVFEIISVNEEIARKGGLFRRDYGKSHGTDLVDAILAASAQTLNAKFVTLNKKHFPMLKEILVPYSRK